MDVTSSITDSVLTLTINRPDRRNSISDGVVNGLLDALDGAQSNDAVRAIVLTGAGEKAFCAGGDLAGFANADGFYGIHRARGGFVSLLEAFRSASKPIIARVNGHALGGGFGLALACDLIVAKEGATIGLPEIKVGVFPMMIMPVVIRNVGRKRALELMLTGERISAGIGSEWGFVNRVGREAFDRVEDMTFSQAVSSLQNDLTIATLTEDAAEGVMAFMSGRDPEWKGK